MLAPGERFDRYTIEVKLGSGGMGEVYRAYDTRLERRVALKILQPPTGDAKTDTAGQAARLLREARAAAALDHPNVVAIFDVGEIEGTTFLAMELIQGRPLRNYIGEDVPITTRVAWLTDVARALALAHRRGLVHRDIKPENVMIRDDGVVKVLDFGIARRTTSIATAATLPKGLGSATTLGPESMMVGTPMYMAPEQMRGEQVDGRTDQFAWGVLAYELLSGGALPWPNAPDLIALVAAVLSTDPAPIPGAQDLPPHVVDVILRAIRRSPDDRFAAMEDVLSALGDEAAASTRALSASQRARPVSTPPSTSDSGRARAAAGKNDTPPKADPKTDPGGERSVDPLAQTQQAGTRSVEPAPRPRRSVAILAAAGALAIAGAASLVVTLRRGPPSDSPAAAPGATATANGGEGQGVRRSIAVVGLKNLAAREDARWIGTALAETMTTELAIGEQLRTIPADDVARMKRDLGLPDAESEGPAALSRVGKRLGADLLVTGAYLAVGGKIRLDLRLVTAASGEALASISESGQESDLIDIVARAGARLRRSLRVSELSEQQATGVRASQPRAPEAARAYAEGLSKLRALDAIGARDDLTRVTTIEPAFAPGHAALSEALAILGMQEAAAREAKQAVDLSMDLRREERMRIEARWREATGEWSKAVELYQALHELFPDNLDYGLGLAAAEVQVGKMTESLAHLAALRGLPAPLGDDPRIDLAEANAYASIGDHPSMKRAAAKVRAKAEPLGGKTLALRAQSIEGFALVSTGEPEEGIALLKSAQKGAEATGDTLLTAEVLGNLSLAHHYRDDLEAALASERELYRRLAEMGNTTDAGILANNIGTTLLSLGRVSEAEREVESQMTSPKAYNRMYARIILGHAKALRGEPAKARAEYSAAIALHSESPDERILAWCQTLLGEVALEEDKLDEAEALLRESLATRERFELKLFSAESRFALARAALARGAVDEAERGARAATETFAAERARSQEAEADAFLVRVLVGAGRAADAAAPLARARELASQAQNPASRLEVQIAGALADAARGDADGARRALSAVIEEATRLGFKVSALQARLALARIDLRAGKAADGKAALEAVARDAAASGLARLAREAKRPRP